MTNREKKLKYQLETHFLNKTISEQDITLIINFVKTYEVDNLNLIDNLMRDRVIESNRIKGAIKQFLNNHPVLTKELIGSLTKRIQGALLSNKPPKKQTLIDKIKKWLN